MPPSARFSLLPATAADATPLAALHTAVARHLTKSYGPGPWSSETSEKGVLQAMRLSQVYVARLGAELVGTLRLATRKPWAIDIRYFSACREPLYLLGMAITPDHQRQGIGSRCLREVERIAKAWPADAIRLDAYDAKAGAGRFYSRCGWKETGRATYHGVPLVYYELLLANA